MERVLDVYARPSDERFPVLCFDEQPCFLIGDVMAPVPMEPGRVAKEDYEYERFGSSAVLLAVEPRTGRRFVKVCARRTAEEYTAFMQDLEQAYPEAVQGLARVVAFAVARTIRNERVMIGDARLLRGFGETVDVGHEADHRLAGAQEATKAVGIPATPRVI